MSNRLRSSCWTLGLSIIALPLSAQQPITLQQAIERAQQVGPAAQSARATRNAARYRASAFYGSQLPQLSLNGTVPAYNRSIIPVQQPDGSTLFKPQQQTNMALSMRLSQKIPLTGGDLFVSSSLARYSLSGATSLDTWSSTPFVVGLRQDLFRPSAASWDRREQSERGERDERAYLESMEDVALATTDLFFNVYIARTQLRNAETNAAVNDTLYRINRGRFDVGRIGENDLLQSELVLLRSRSALEGARLDFERALANLRLALRLPPGAPIDVAVTPEVPVYDVDTTLAVTEALRNRSTVSDLALQSIQSRRHVTEARLSNWLGATVTASYGYNATGDAASLAYRDLRDAQQFTLSVSLPLWQWGAHSETVRAAEEDRDRVSIQTESSMEQLANEAHFAALDVAQARSNVALLAKADSVAGKRFEVAYSRYVIGRISVDILYIAQAEKDQALTQFGEGLRRYWRAHHWLRRVTLYDFQAGRPIR